MIQDTTLRMVVEAVDRASAPLESVKDKVDGLSNSIDGTKAAAEDALPAVGKAATDVVDDFDDLGRSAASAAFHLGPGMIEAIAAAGFAFVALVKYIREANAEHERLRDLSTSLSLPYETVKTYSESWLKVAQALNEVANGYRKMSDAQSAAMASIGLSPGNKRENDTTRTAIALGKGTDREKIDTLRRLFGIGDDQTAINIIKEENKKFFREVSQSGGLGVSDALAERVLKGDNSGVTPDIAQRIRSFTNSSGIGFGQLDVSQLAGRTASPNSFADFQELQKEAEQQRKKAVSEMQKAEDDARKAATDAEKKAAQERLQRMRDQYDQQAAFAQQGVKLAEDEAKALSKVLAENDKEIGKSSSDAWKTINEQVGRELKELQFPVNEFVETWKDAMKDMVFFGDFSFKRLVARIIVQLTSKELFAAIDRVGDALSDAMSGGGGGGLFSKVGKFLGGIFGNAGGGQESGLRWVGEEGPELVASGPNAMRVYNMRQMAFAGGGGSQQSTKYYDHRTYNISGVETQQVIGYIEQTRREDQRGIVRMLERNGLGSMR